MARQTRRKFLKKTASAGAAYSLFTISGTKSSGEVVGANSKIRVAVVGIHGRGGYHSSVYSQIEGVEVTHLVDVDASQFEPAKKRLESSGARAPRCFQDVRDVLDDPNVDAVSIATCNHTHALYTVWACQAGKDVYVEKPLSHNVFEGRQCVEAARRYHRVVQHGTQQRSQQSWANEIAAVQSGNYGKLLVSKGYCCKPRWSIGYKPIEDPPAHLDFKLWLGPAPEQPFHTNLVHYNWHWFRDFGNGDIGNRGVHQIDVARWAIPGATLPTRVWSLGGRFGYDDQGETPNIQLSAMEFGDVTLLFETRGLVGKHKGFERQLHNEYYTTEGLIREEKFYPQDGGEAVPISGGTPRQVAQSEHGPFGCFIQAIRSRRPEDNNADAEVGHYSSALCHLGNISYWLGEEVPFSARQQSLGDNKQVVEAFEKVKANCRAVGMDLAESTYQMGRVLEFDPRTEKFVDDKEANRLLTREYRAPFVMPETV
jgi:predicted dehydrogenase